MTDVVDSLKTFVYLASFICPPEFWPALGYEGEARYVAVYWEQCGDEAAWADGRVAFAGAFWPAYQSLMHQNFSPGHPYHWLLGASDAPAIFWLIIDRETEDAWLVPADQAEEILRRQWPAPVGDAADLDMSALLAMLSAEPAMTVAANAAGPITVQQIEQAIADEERDFQALIAALDARPARWQKQEPS